MGVVVLPAGFGLSTSLGVPEHIGGVVVVDVELMEVVDRDVVPIEDVVVVESDVVELDVEPIVEVVDAEVVDVDVVAVDDIVSIAFVLESPFTHAKYPYWPFEPGFTTDTLPPVAPATNVESVEPDVHPR
jgi:hypothetical protein